ncbi:hypothetical protein ACUOCP_20940, partial [Escherichia sp. R-CC3]
LFVGDNVGTTARWGIFALNKIFGSLFMLVGALLASARHA